MNMVIIKRETDQTESISHRLEKAKGDYADLVTDLDTDLAQLK